MKIGGGAGGATHSHGRSSARPAAFFLNHCGATTTETVVSDPDHHDPVVALLMKGDLSDSATVRAMRKAATDPTLWSFVNPTTREALFIPTVRLKILGGTLDDLLEDLETFSLLAINQRLDEIFRERKRTFFYGCLAHAKRGETVCDNALVLPIERVDRAVQAELATNVLRPAVVRALINAVFKKL
jgi:hypothetical protein